MALWGSDTYVSLCKQAAEFSQRGDFTGAITKYKAALRLQPGAPEALNNLAVMHYQVGQFSEAWQITSVLWKAHRELRSAALIAGMAAVQSDRASQAIEPLESLLESDPSNRDALLALASARYALRDLNKAAETYERTLALYPQDSKAWYGRAICYEQLAEGASLALSKMPGGSSYSKRLLGEYLQNLGDEKLAAEAFGDSAASRGVYPEAERQYLLTRDLALKSRESFEHFVSLAPDSWQAALFLGDVDRQHGNLTSAIAHYQLAEREQPGNPAPLLGLSTAYWELGKFDEARAYLQRTLRLNPNSMQAVFELANIEVRQHRDAEAIPLLKRYLNARPDALAARADLGRAYFHLKMYGNATAELGKAVALDTTGEIYYQLSVSLRHLDRGSEADAALKSSERIRNEQLERAQRLRAVN